MTHIRKVISDGSCTGSFECVLTAAQVSLVISLSASTGYGCQSCSWAAEQRKSNSPLFHRNMHCDRGSFGRNVSHQLAYFLLRLNLVVTKYVRAAPLSPAFEDGVLQNHPCVIRLLSDSGLVYQQRSQQVRRRHRPISAYSIIVLMDYLVSDAFFMLTFFYRIRQFLFCF